jgi:hypothetical protein
MVESAIIPENTVIEGNGDGPVVQLRDSKSRIFLVAVTINEVVEQESFELSLFGSADGTTWGAKPLLKFPQQFYRGETPMLLDLTNQPDVKYLRAHWEVNRWGRGPDRARFVVSATVKEVPREMLTAK